MFLVNSRYPLACAPALKLPSRRASFFRSYGGILPSSFSIVLSSALVCSTCPPVSVWGTVHNAGAISWDPFTASLISSRERRFTGSVTTREPGNINPVPIDYAFRPRLRGRLTLRRLALRRKPWTFGERVFHPLCRYSCQHSHFRYLQRLSQGAFAGLRNAPLPRFPKEAPAASAHGLSPVTFSAQDPLFRPVSYYAFFK